MRFFTARKQLIVCLLFQALLLVTSRPEGFQPEAECQRDSDCEDGFECTKLNRCLAKDCIARELSVAGQQFDPFAFKNMIWAKAGVTDDFLIQLKRDTSDEEFAHNPIVQNLMATINDHSYELMALASVVQACENGDTIPPVFHRQLEEKGNGFSRWVGGLFKNAMGISGEQSSTPMPSASPSMSAAPTAPTTSPSASPSRPVLTQRSYTGLHIEGGFIFDFSYTQFQESGNSTQASPTQFKRGCFGAEVGAGAEVSIFLMITSNLAVEDVIGGSFLLEQDIGLGAVFGAAAGLYVTGEQWSSSCPMYLEITLGGGCGIGIGSALCRTGVVV